MDDMERKMGAILGNPDMMQKIMAMAQSLNQPEENQHTVEPPPTQTTGSFGLPNLDPAMLNMLSGIAGQSGIDSNQRSLLNALTPYLSRERIIKLEKAMRAAKLVNLASSFLGNQGLSALLGR